MQTGARSWCKTKRRKQLATAGPRACRVAGSAYHEIWKAYEESPAMTKEQSIELAQAYRQMWEQCTSRPLTTRELQFAHLVRNAALEEAAQEVKVQADYGGSNHQSFYMDTISVIRRRSFYMDAVEIIRNMKEPAT